MRFMTFRNLFASAATLLLIGACNSPDSATGALPAKEAVAATVNGVPVSEGLVDRMLKERVAMGREASPEARRRFLDRLVMQVMVADAAVKKGLDKEPAVSDKLELARLSILADAFVADFRKANPVSEDALKAEYDKFAAAQAGTEYKARHILLASESDANAIIARLKADPKAFEALAREKSEDSGSKASGGELGWIDPHAMVPEFAKAVVQLAKGKFTETPVKSQFGYHVILLEDSRPKPVPPLQQVRTQLTDKIQRDNLNKLVEEMKGKATIVITQAPVAGQAGNQTAKDKAATPDSAKHAQ